MTISAAVRSVILADTTLAAKVQEVYPVVANQGSTANFGVVKIFMGSSWKSLDGATQQVAGRLRVAFHCKLASDAEICGNQFRSIMSGFKGLLGGSGGVKMSVHQTFGPYPLHDPDTRLYISEVDIMAVVDMSTVS